MQRLFHWRKEVLLFAMIFIAFLFCSIMFLSWQAQGFQGGSAPPEIKPTGEAGDPSGKSTYVRLCSTCHGVDGKGDGPAAGHLDPRPRDFTSGIFKIRTTATGTLPTDDDIRRSITEGLHSSAMPDWKNFLHGDTLQTVVNYIKTFSTRFMSEQPKPVTPGPEPQATPSSIQSGRNVFQKLQCGTCHGVRGDRIGATSTDLTDDWGNPVTPADLTAPWTFKGGSTARDIYLRFTTGMDGTPMPSFFGSASEREMWDLAHYVVSIARKPVWHMNAVELQSLYDEQSRRDKSDPVGRGKYLVDTHGCASCHSPVHPDGRVIEGLKLAGGMKFDIYPFGVYVTHNLTSDKESGLGNYTDDQIRRAITRGIAGAGWRMLPFPMPWTSYANMSDDDVNAIIAYLRTVPAVSNTVPPPEHLNVLSYLWGKFRLLILHQNIPERIYPGNAGNAPVDTTTSGKEAQP